LNQLNTTVKTFPVTDFENIKIKMLNWADRFNIFSFLDNCNYTIQPHKHECLMAVDAISSCKAVSGEALQQLQEWLQQNKGWAFGHIGYDLKNEIEDLASNNPDGIQFPDLFFFQPKTVIQLNDDSVIIESFSDPEKIFSEILTTEEPIDIRTKEIDISNRLEKQEYISVITKLKEHIKRGDCYEINFCMEFFAEDVSIDAIRVYSNLCQESPNPFSALYKLNDKYLICASPERYIRKEGGKILSQPIKGTSLRDRYNVENDSRNKQSLITSEKEKAENVMVVDLVRNDLSKICSEGSVKVDELFGIYSFPQVHQMISTVSGELKSGVEFTDCIRATFPMGSMTGAPKKRVMELIEQYEKTKRGIFAGTVGYINPEGDFDFNVVIRSIMYSQSLKYLSYQAGSGITFHCDAEKEWEECLLKVSAIKKLLTN
jgi:para-aminobenzoate synthetase component I